MLKRAGLKAVDFDTLERVNEIISRCEPCQRIQNELFRFRVSVDYGGVRFNSREYIAILYLE